MNRSQQGLPAKRGVFRRIAIALIALQVFGIVGTAGVNRAFAANEAPYFSYGMNIPESASLDINNGDYVISGYVLDDSSSPITVNALLSNSDGNYEKNYTSTTITPSGAQWNHYFTITWRWEELPEGDYSLFLTARDAGGQIESYYPPYSIVVDRTRPTNPIINPANGTWTKTSTQVTITEGLDANPTETYYRSYPFSTAPSGYVRYMGSFSIPDDRRTTIEAYTIDSVGNRSSVMRSEIGVLVTPPTKPFLSATDLNWTNQDVVLDTTVSMSPGGSPIVLMYGKRDGSNQFMFTNGKHTATLEGEHTYVSFGSDAAANLGEESDPVTVKIDKTLPTVAIAPNGSTDWQEEGSEVDVVLNDSLSGVVSASYAVTSDGTTPSSWNVLPLTVTGNSATAKVPVEGVGTRYVHIRATDAAGNQVTQVSDSFLVQDLPIDANLTGVAQNANMVALTWDAPASSETQGYTYKVENTNTGAIYNVEYPNLTVTDTSAIPGVLNRYVLTSTNKVGSATSETSVLTQPGLVSSITPTPDSLSGTDMRVDFNATSGAESYRVRVTDNESSVVVYDEVVSSTSALVTGLNQGRNYTVSVAGINAAGQGDASVTGFLTLPAVPGNVYAAIAGVDSIRLAWQAVDSATEYTVRRGGVELGTVTDTVYENTGLASGTSYDYTVQAINATGAGNESSPVTLTTLPDAVTSFVLTSPSATSLTAIWGASVGATSYEVELESNNSTVDVQMVTDPTYTFTGLTPGTSYTVYVTPYGVSGNGDTVVGSAVTLPSGVSTITTGTVNATDAQFVFDLVPGATSYKFTVNGTPYVASSSPFVISSLTGSTNYTVLVQAGNASGYEEGQEVSFLTKPKGVSGLSVQPSGLGEVAVSWDVDPTAIEYIVSVGGVEDRTSQPSFLLSDLVLGEKIVIEVRAVNATGEGLVASIEGTPGNALPDIEEAPASKNGVSINVGTVSGVDHYEVTSPDGTIMYYSGTGPVLEITGLEDGRTYDMVVYAVTESGLRSEPAPVTVTTIPGVIPGTVVDKATKDSVTITLPVTDKNVDTYIITRDGQVVAEVSASDKEWVDAEVTPNTGYTYEVIPVNSSGQGDPIVIEVKTPTAPVIGGTVEYAPKDGNIELGFDPVPGAVEYILYEDGVEVWRGSTTPAVIPTPGTGVSHDYKLVVDNGTPFKSEPIDIVVTLQPSTPSGVQLVTTPDSIVVDFSKAPGTNGYVVISDGKVIGEVAAGESSLVISPVDPSKSYNLEIYPKTSSGEVSTEVEKITVRTDTPSGVTPPVDPPVDPNPPVDPPVDPNPPVDPPVDPNLPVDPPVTPPVTPPVVVPPVVSPGSPSTGNPSTGTPVTPPVAVPAPVPTPTPVPVPVPTPLPTPAPIPVPVVPPVVFTDITQSFAATSIMKLVQQGVIKGVSDTNFEPKRAVTRMEFAALIVRSQKAQASGTVDLSFTDISNSAWYVEELKTAVALGIIKGVSPTKIAPLEGVTREQAVTMVVRSLYGTDLPSGTLAVRDSSQVSSWAMSYVAKAMQEGLIAGYADGTFRPNAIMTREEAAALIDRSLR